MAVVEVVRERERVDVRDVVGGDDEPPAGGKCSHPRQSRFVSSSIRDTIATASRYAKGNGCLPLGLTHYPVLTGSGLHPLW